MNRKRLFQIVVMALLVVGAAYLLSTGLRPARTADDEVGSDALAADPPTAAPTTETVSALAPYLPMTVTKEDLTLESGSSIARWRWM